MLKKMTVALLLCWCVTNSTVVSAQEPAEREPVKRPRVFLDKNPRIVAYQLKRLPNEQLLLVERATDHEKYKPVFTAILLRAGMARQDRDQALAGLVALDKSNAADELLAVLAEIDPDERQERRVGRQLVAMLLEQASSVLARKQETLTQATDSDNSLLRATGYAGLVSAGAADAARKLAARNAAATLDFLSAVVLVPKTELRVALRESVVASLSEKNPEEVRRAAVNALAHIPNGYDETFRLLAPLAADRRLQTAAVQTLLKVPAKHRSADVAGTLATRLVQQAESTPAAKRTTDDFLDAMQLADQLFALLPAEAARSLRQRLSEVTVRVVIIHTVEEEMRYDVPFFAVEAGRDVQIVLKNEDLMPHNLVITAPGAPKEVALEGAATGPDQGADGKPYVPKSEKVLFATNMVPSNRQERLTFTAPDKPGEYPFVCTFPRHWMRMYGVMVVVDDLEEWTKNPNTPADPTGNTRTLVRNWTFEELSEDLETGLRGRSSEIGKRMFVEATCASCHKIGKEGGAVGPELTDLFGRWKGDRQGILREVIDPSHKIEPKYAVQLIATLDGKVLSGIVTAEDKDSVSVLVNPEAPAPSVIQRDDIDEIVKSSKSMMPKGLLDRFTKDEIFELMHYLESVSGAKGN